jgi:hypothetical protein
VGVGCLPMNESDVVRLWPTIITIPALSFPAGPPCLKSSFASLRNELAAQLSILPVPSTAPIASVQCLPNITHLVARHASSVVISASFTAIALSPACEPSSDASLYAESDSG